MYLSAATTFLFILKLSKMVVMRDPTQSPSNSNSTTVEYTHWSRNVTLRLINEYEKKNKKT